MALAANVFRQTSAKEHSYARNHHTDRSFPCGAVEPIVGTACSAYAGCSRPTSTRATCAEEGWPVRPDRCSMPTGGFCSQRCQERHWDRGGLHPTNHGGHATGGAERKAFAAN